MGRRRLKFRRAETPKRPEPAASWRLSARAAVRTAGPTRSTSVNADRPETDSAAAGRPSEPKIGAAAQTVPAPDSSRSKASCVVRMVASSRSRPPGVTIVNGLSDGCPASIRALTTAAGENASSAFPTPVAWAGSRPPIRDGMPGAPLCRRIST